MQAGDLQVYRYISVVSHVRYRLDSTHHDCKLNQHCHRSNICNYKNQDSLVVSHKAACARPANATTGVLFTGTNAEKFPSAVTRSSWALSLSYYRASTFLPCRISKPKMKKLGATIVKNQLFRLLWRPFPYLRLKLDRLESNSVVTKELIPLFYVESANQHSLQSVRPPLLRGFQYFILWLKKILTGHRFFFIFAHPARLSIFKKWSG